MATKPPKPVTAEKFLADFQKLLANDSNGVMMAVLQTAGITLPPPDPNECPPFVIQPPDLTNFAKQVTDAIIKKIESGNLNKIVEKVIIDQKREVIQCVKTLIDTSTKTVAEQLNNSIKLPISKGAGIESFYTDNTNLSGVNPAAQTAVKPPAQTDVKPQTGGKCPEVTANEQLVNDTVKKIEDTLCAFLNGDTKIDIPNKGKKTPKEHILKAIDDMIHTDPKVIHDAITTAITSNNSATSCAFKCAVTNLKRINPTNSIKSRISKIFKKKGGTNRKKTYQRKLTHKKKRKNKKSMRSK
jgi:hypothetical protein